MMIDGNNRKGKTPIGKLCLFVLRTIAQIVYECKVCHTNAPHTTTLVLIVIHTLGNIITQDILIV